MDPTYLEQLRRAQETTRELGLEPEFAPELRSLPVRYEALEQWLVDGFRSVGYTSDDMVGKCGLRHAEIHLNLEFGPKIRSVLTLGDVLVDGTPRYGLARETLGADFFSEENRSRPFFGHVWLTLDDGGILDVTLPMALGAEMRVRRLTSLLVCRGYSGSEKAAGRGFTVAIAPGRSVRLQYVPYATGLEVVHRAFNLDFRPQFDVESLVADRRRAGQQARSNQA